MNTASSKRPKKVLWPTRDTAFRYSNTCKGMLSKFRKSVRSEFYLKWSLLWYVNKCDQNFFLNFWWRHFEGEEWFTEKHSLTMSVFEKWLKQHCQSPFRHCMLNRDDDHNTYCYKQLITKLNEKWPTTTVSVCKIKLNNLMCLSWS